MADEFELTILMPCLNEEKSLAFCIEEARNYLEESGVLGEILVADNGSTDMSCRIAKEMGIRVAEVSEKGYGSTLIKGIEASRGKYVVVGDCDGSYDFSAVGAFLGKLKEGY